MTIATAQPLPAEDDRPALARPGRNCRCVARADRFGLVIDGEDYYRALAHALEQARHSVLLVGWEFDSRTRLLRGADPFKGEEVGELLARIVRRRPGLRVNVLIWDTALIYVLGREFLGPVKMGWLTPRRLTFRLDDSHPLGASHHQKIVVVDDALAFVGGLDVASMRWDTRSHLPADVRRSDEAEVDYPPFHDMMAAVTGDAARALGDVCRDRWFCATGQRLAPSEGGDPHALWPDWLSPAFTNVDMAVARTHPSWDGEAGVREIETLYCDMIAAARRFIYIENQYFASRLIADAIAARLKQPDCPEVVVVNPGEPPSLVERSTMGVARARIYRALLQADCANRLKIYHPTHGGRDIKVHAKLMIVDDVMLRVGSSNLNNRSMGLDTECDVLVEAQGDRGTSGQIAAIRRDLMAEHLGVSPQAVADAETVAGSLHGAIAMLKGGDRTLADLPPDQPHGVVGLIADSAIPDPEEPVETLVWIEEAMPGPAKRPLQIRVWMLAALLVGLCLAAILWRWAPYELWSAVRPALDWLAARQHLPETAVVMAVAFLAGGLARLPVSLMVVLTGALMGVWLGAAVGLFGAVASASTLFALGRVLKRARVRRIGGWKVNRVQRALTRHGIMAIVVLRMAPVAAFAVINMVAGAAGVKFRDFVIGTILGMAPGVFAMSVVGDRLTAVLRDPSAVNIAVLSAAVAVVILAVFALVDRLARARQAGARPQRKA